MSVVVIKQNFYFKTANAYILSFQIVIVAKYEPCKHQSYNFTAITTCCLWNDIMWRNLSNYLYQLILFEKKIHNDF